MPDKVQITINGSSEALLPPERGEVSLRISDSGLDPTIVAGDVRRAAKEVRTLIEDLATRDYVPSKDDTNMSTTASSASEQAPAKTVTKFTSTTLATRSYMVSEDADSDVDSIDERDKKKKKKKVRKHEATVRMTADFFDFTALGRFTTSMADRPLVAVEGVKWSLTKPTQRVLRNTAIGDAYAAAVEKANAFAKAMGRETVVPLEISSLHDGMRAQYGNAMAPRGVRMRKMAAPVEDDDVSPMPQDVAYEITCQVTFECR
ncbi:hypothetical protein ANO11243_006820 [Dothideomycetidae sp. 11243]|nr:hypothetical protein ANO11243_006820 [fungal sp. No.11243]